MSWWRLVRSWLDPYAPGGVRTGKRCRAIHGDRFRCVRERGHTSRGRPDGHRWTSSADGRSIVWSDERRSTRGGAVVPWPWRNASNEPASVDLPAGSGAAGLEAQR